MRPNIKRTQRITLSVASKAENLGQLVLAKMASPEGTGFGPSDLSFGWSIYEGHKEVRVDVTLHETTVRRVLDAWAMIRRDADTGVDCGRVYFADGTDYCCKDLDNYLRRKDGTVEQFPGFSFKLGKPRLAWVRR